MTKDPLRRFRLFETNDPDDAMTTIDRLYGKKKYKILNTSSGHGTRSLSAASVYGTTSLSEASVSRLVWCRLITAFDFTFVQDEPEHCIALAFQASGHRHVALGSQSEFTTSGSIGSLAPQDRPLKSFFSRGETLSLMIPHSVIQQNLESMIGNASTPIEFEPIVDSRNGGGAMLRRTIDMVAAQLAEPESPLGHPAVAARLEEFIVHALLHGQPHSYRDAIADDHRAAAPKQVRRAEAFIHGHSGETIRLAQIADAAGCSVRALQLAFRTFRDTTPMTLLKQTRLARAHSELSQSDPEATTVTEVAIKYGFYNVGRFAQDYKRTFGQRPSETLRLRVGRQRSV